MTYSSVLPWVRNWVRGRATHASPLQVQSAIRVIGIAALLFTVTGLSSGEPAVKFWIGGDVNLGKDGKKVFAQMTPVVAGNPGFVNLEGPVIFKDEARTRLKVFNENEGLNALNALGVRAVSIANNHARDAGAGGPAATIAALREAKIIPAGLAAGAATLEFAGRKIIFTSHDLSRGLPIKLRDELVAAHKAGDLLVATFHVSGAPAEKPSKLLRQAVDIAMAAGARVIAAHGSHRLGPVERRGGAVIAWGLGNLAFSCDCTRERAGMILEITIDDDGALRGAVIPIRAGIKGGPVELEPRPEIVFTKMKAMSGSVLRRDGVRGWF